MVDALSTCISMTELYWRLLYKLIATYYGCEWASDCNQLMLASFSAVPEHMLFFIAVTCHTYCKHFGLELLHFNFDNFPFEDHLVQWCIFTLNIYIVRHTTNKPLKDFSTFPSLLHSHGKPSNFQQPVWTKVRRVSLGHMSQPLRCGQEFPSQGKPSGHLSLTVVRFNGPKYCLGLYINNISVSSVCGHAAGNIILIYPVLCSAYTLTSIFNSS